jgi:enoyl-CoA hydratase/carnithine racemase
VALTIADRARPHGGLVRTLTLARPEKRNALDREHLVALGSAVARAAREPLVRVLVISAAGSAFSAGYDLSTPFDAEAPDTLVMRTMALVRASPLPVVAAVQGAAFGAGLELAMSADLRLASDAATFCLPPAKLGIAYASEGLARLVSLVGTAAARRLAFTGEVLDATEALRIRLIDGLTTAEGLAAKVHELADRLADAAPLAVRTMKATFNALEPVLPAEHRAAFEEERVALFTSEDAAEGLAAFAERRLPVFRGR